MERNRCTLLALILIIPIMWFFPEIAKTQESFDDTGASWISHYTTRAQSQSRDDGILWIAFELVDGDAGDDTGIIRDTWTEKCAQESPETLRDWMPFGVRQDHESQLRSLPDDMCERVVVIRLSGLMSGELVADKTVPWQPGENGGRWLGIPRDGTTSVRIRFPRTLLVGNRLYDVPDPILVKTGGSERLVIVSVTLRRLTVVNVSANDEQSILFDRYVLRSSPTRTFLLPGTRMLRAQKGYMMNVVAVDERNERHAITSPTYPESILEISANYGWEYEVEVIPKRNSRLEWLASLRRNAN